MRNRERPRCSNCPEGDECPHGKQKCDHEACSRHPREAEWLDMLIDEIRRNGEKEIRDDDCD